MTFFNATYGTVPTLLPTSQNRVFLTLGTLMRTYPGQYHFRCCYSILYYKPSCEELRGLRVILLRGHVVVSSVNAFSIVVNPNVLENGSLRLLVGFEVLIVQPLLL